MSDQRVPSWVRYSGVGLELAGAIAGFTLLGYWIDGKFGTSPWGVLGGVILGLIGGMYNMVKQSLAAIRDARTEDSLPRDDTK